MTAKKNIIRSLRVHFRKIMNFFKKSDHDSDLENIRKIYTRKGSESFGKYSKSFRAKNENLIRKKPGKFRKILLFFRDFSRSEHPRLQMLTESVDFGNNQRIGYKKDEAK